MIVIECSSCSERHSVYVAIAEDAARILHLKSLEDDICANLVDTSCAGVVRSDRPLITFTLTNKFDIRELYLTLHLILNVSGIDVSCLFIKACTAFSFRCCRRVLHALIACEKILSFVTSDVCAGIRRSRYDTGHVRAIEAFIAVEDRFLIFFASICFSLNMCAHPHSLVIALSNSLTDIQFVGVLRIVAVINSVLTPVHISN